MASYAFNIRHAPVLSHNVSKRSKMRAIDYRIAPVTLETSQPEKPTPSGFRAQNYKIRLGEMSSNL